MGPHRAHVGRHPRESPRSPSRWRRAKSARLCCPGARESDNHRARRRPGSPLEARDFALGSALWPGLWVPALSRAARTAKAGVRLRFPRHTCRCFDRVQLGRGHCHSARHGSCVGAQFGCSTHSPGGRYMRLRGRIAGSRIVLGQRLRQRGDNNPRFRTSFMAPSPHLRRRARCRLSALSSCLCRQSDATIRTICGLRRGRTVPPRLSSQYAQLRPASHSLTDPLHAPARLRDLDKPERDAAVRGSGDGSSQQRHVRGPLGMSTVLAQLPTIPRTASHLRRRDPIALRRSSRTARLPGGSRHMRRSQPA